MEFKDLRYFFEHKVLCEYFERKPGAFIMGVLTEKEVIINNAFKNLCEDNECEYPFKEEDFTVELLKFDDEYLVIKIDMPEPKFSPECYNIFIAFKQDMTVAKYFTLEYDDIVKGKFLCSWHDGKHSNYGALEDPDSIEEVLAKIYMIIKK